MAAAITNGQPVVDALDLDAELDALDLSPVPVSFGGRMYYVRRDLTGLELREFWRLTKEQKDQEALCILVGPDDGVTLNLALDNTPNARSQIVLKRIMQKAGLLLDDRSDKPGESRAS